MCIRNEVSHQRKEKRLDGERRKRKRERREGEERKRERGRWETD